MSDDIQKNQGKLNKVYEFFARAEALEKEDQGNPFDTKNLADAFNLYQQCNYLIPNSNIINAAKKCQNKINWRHQFQHFFNEGNQAFKQGFFRKALDNFLQAKNIFCTQGVKTAINNCQSRLKEEEEYEKNLNQAYKLSEEGYFHQAFILLKPIAAQFPRQDGKKLLLELQNIIKGKAFFMAGLLAEKKGDLEFAKEKYQNAIKIIPELEKYIIRLAIIHFKLNEFSEALQILKNIKNQQSYYLQGLIYAKKKQWKKIYQYWKYLPNNTIKKQQELIKKLVIKDRLENMKVIEDYIELKNFDESKLASENFIKKFGNNSLIKKNLDYHIIPYLRSQQWQEKNLDIKKLNQETEKQWIKNTNIVSLHNLMVSQYYLFSQDKGSLKNLIPIWMTNINNLENNPILKNIDWLNYDDINLPDFSENLQELLEEYIEEFKIENLELYLKLRDIYRREKWALKLSQNENNFSIKINDIFITPEFYEKYYKHQKNINIPLNILGSLYTPWGYTVTACLEKDITRAIAIKPTSITSKIEKFSQKFVYYNIGCFYLENNQWEKAIDILNSIKIEILNSQEWIENINKLCQTQQHNIKYFNENLEFSEFWYNLISNADSLSYFSEYQAQKIILHLDQEKISFTEALFELKQLQKLDKNNPIVNDLLEKLEFEKEIEIINYLFNQKKFEEGIEKAKNSPYERVKMTVAQLCIHILIEGFKNNELNFNDIYKLGKWAYELYPQDPAVAEIYQFSQELYEIQTLMLDDKFDQAVEKAKNSDHDLVRKYVAEFFIKTLLSGIENEDIPFEMVKRLALWAYELCPNESSYKEIYESLDIIN